MTALSPIEILAIMNDVISGDKPLLAWEYLVSVNHKDEFTKRWAARLKDLENQFHVEGSGILLSEEGVAKLMQLREELEREGADR